MRLSVVSSTPLALVPNRDEAWDDEADDRPFGKRRDLAVQPHPKAEPDDVADEDGERGSPATVHDSDLRKPLQKSKGDEGGEQREPNVDRLVHEKGDVAGDDHAASSEPEELAIEKTGRKAEPDRQGQQLNLWHLPSPDWQSTPRAPILAPQCSRAPSPGRMTLRGPAESRICRPGGPGRRRPIASGRARSSRQREQRCIARYRGARPRPPASTAHTTRRAAAERSGRSDLQLNTAMRLLRPRCRRSDCSQM